MEKEKEITLEQVCNDNIEMEKDLPRYYKTFSGVKFLINGPNKEIFLIK